MTEQKLYKDTFDKFTLPAETISQLKQMKVPAKKTAPLYKIAGAFALFLLLLLSGNGITYAMTGDSLVDKAQEFYAFLTKPPIQEQNISVNGNIEDQHSLSPAKVVRTYVNENGLHCYVVNVGNRLMEYSVRIDGDPAHTSVIIYHQKYQQGSSAGLALYEGALVSQDDKIFLTIVNDDISLDITSDFSDGYATGTFEDSIDGIYTETLEYTVVGDMNDYTVDIQWKESPE